MTGDPALDGELEVQPALALSLELVERAIAEVQRQDAEIALLHGVIDALLEADEPVVVVEAGVVRGWSAGLERATRTSASAAVGRPLSTVLPIDLTAEDACWVDRDGVTWRVQATPAGDRLRVVRLLPTSQPCRA